MDDQNKSLKEGWAPPADVPERAYAGDEATDDRRTAEIRSDIERTRADMSETIDAIQDRVRPSNIVSRATETVRDATVGKAKDMARSARETLSSTRPDRPTGGVVDRLRNNPIPTALAVGSIAWIAFGSRSRPRTSPAIYGSARDDEAYLRETTITDDFPERGGASPRAGMRLRQATSRVQTGGRRLMRDNPLAAGAIATAVGLTVGLALPTTEPENELMGEARDAVVNRAQETARGAAERVQDAAQRVQDAAAEAVRSVTPER